ncbi:hypothetical protein BJX96DRAFT_151944 [Aspergillus floccosus]
MLQYHSSKHEQFLFPFGIALAWSLVLDGRVQDAIKLLEDIIYGSERFEMHTTKHTSQLRPSTLQPLRELLYNLHTANRFSQRFSMPQLPDDIPLAKVHPTGIEKNKFVYLGPEGREQLARNGILFAEKSILIPFSPLSKSRRGLRGYRSRWSTRDDPLLRGLFLPYLSGTDISHILAHLPGDSRMK